MARTWAQMVYDGETVETLQSALDELNKLKAPSEAWAAKICANRDELLRELAVMNGTTVEQQPRLL